MQSYNFNIIFGYIIVILFMFVIPGFFTIWNIVNLVSKKPRAKKTIALLTLIIGGLLYFGLYCIVYDTAGDWYEAVYPTQRHYAISTEYSPIIFLPDMFGIFGLFLLMYRKPEKTPPLLTVFSIASVILLNVISVVFAIQISVGSFDPLWICFYIYHFNVLIISAMVVRDHMREQAAYLSSREEDFEERKGIMWLYMKVTKVSQYALPVFAALFIIVAVLEIFAVLAGAGIDAPIKAFTDTADWNFSTQTPPPPLVYEGHYLCTVAAGGHEKVVKPIRLGRRRGAVIVVNRQLCIANAFEESIADHFPRFHKWIRHVYDTYGYPLSNLITSRTKADVVYFLMKPLEWVFLLYLYLTDARPEVRINRQYKM